MRVVLMGEGAAQPVPVHLLFGPSSVLMRSFLLCVHRT